MSKEYFLIVKEAAKDAIYDVFVELVDFYNRHEILCDILAAMYIWNLIYA